MPNFIKTNAVYYLQWFTFDLYYFLFHFFCLHIYFLKNFLFYQIYLLSCAFVGLTLLSFDKLDQCSLLMSLFFCDKTHFLFYYFDFHLLKQCFSATFFHHLFSIFTQLVHFSLASIKNCIFYYPYLGLNLY